MKRISKYQGVQKEEQSLIAIQSQNFFVITFLSVSRTKNLLKSPEKQPKK